MDRFFKKHGHRLGEEQALGLISNKLKEAEMALNEGKDCYAALIDAHGMIEDIFAIKKINPDEYYEQEQELEQQQYEQGTSGISGRAQYARGSRGVR